MHAQLLVYISIIAISGVFNLYLFAYVFHKRHFYKSISTYFLAYIFAIIIYCFGSVFSLMSTNIIELKFWTAVMYLGLPFASPLGLLFVTKYLAIKLKRGYIIYMLTIPTISSILVATNDMHHLYYRRLEIDPVLGAPYFLQEIGIWYLVQGILTFGCMLAAFILLASHYKEMSEQYKPQIIALMFGHLVPMFTGFIYLLGLTPRGIDPVPMVIWISSLLCLWAINSSQLFKIMPVAKDVIFNSINDAVMVLDESLRLVEINQACKIQFPGVNHSILGTNINKIWNDLFNIPFTLKIGITEASIKLNEEKVYQVRMSMLDPLRNINGYLVIFTDITEIKRLQALLEYQAYYDELTQIYNRRAFLQQCELDLADSQKKGAPFAIVLMDVDHFKKVNDIYGHHIGDQLLEHIVTICKLYLTNGEVFARYGGEEFVFSLTDYTTAKAEALANMIRDHIKKTPMITSEGEIGITLSLGIAEAERGVGETVSSLLNKADKALYQAKRTGRNKVNVYCQGNVVI
ncbi:diguanylate cyclase [Marinilactibacillus sp. 15R]|uniref:Diguanylate cyclase (GGDEF) domain-containing protein n=1 Tax=Marinilactibacillus piezotolerans TaxID=258723 RepID=A0A1I3XEJ4_9LACT|nr:MULTISPECIES: histidine kinase N-terminal 7TM domain-containing protein [Marinilactibacillus]API88242.1 diguanylate cyclase [Marinilactibacillus sp. 15R]SFK17957.1 diguanylate cyclase (GGDEF) domain-containing protein [Marinilactibacillus piezotolerans]